jgi:hypothetical protein
MSRTGIVYKIWSDIDDETYVGSTWDTPNQRKTNHICKYQALIRNDKEVTKSLSHFNNIGWNNIKVDVLEEREFVDIDDRLFCEREWIEEINPSLNTMRRPRITEEERKQWNKDYYQRPEVRERQLAYMKDYNKKYREEHKDMLKAKGQEWREKNKEAIKAKRETDEYKQKKNERRRNKVHHCDICNIELKGDNHVMKRHLKCKAHLEKAQIKA